MIYLAWKVLGALSRFHWWEKYASQNIFYLSIFALIRLRRIYNFLLFHANILQLLYTFGNFLYYFGD